MTGNPTEAQGTGRVCVVTGGAGGLGRAMAAALVAAGASVVVADKNRTGVAAATDELGPTSLGVVADISTEEGVEEVFAAALERFGRVEVLVNNAGIGMGEVRPGDRYTDPIRFVEVTPEHLRRFFDVHVLGQFMMTRRALPLMLSEGWGRVVNVTTSLGTMQRPGNAPYGPMKAASEAFCAIVAGEVEGTGVSANILIPGGGADTPMVPDVPGRSRAGLVPPAAMGPPIVWLASERSDGTNGRRLLARLWDPALGEDAAAAAAGFPIGWPASS